MKSYKLDMENQRIIHTVEGQEAYWQFVQKSLSTEKYYWDLYSENFGLRNMQSYIGKDKEYIMAHFPQDVRDCLMTDPFKRTIDIDSFEYEDVPGGVLCRCRVISVFGERVLERQLPT